MSMTTTEPQNTLEQTLSSLEQTRSSVERTRSSLQQTRSIVAQVDREIQQQAARSMHRHGPELIPPAPHSAPARSAPAQQTGARRFMLSLIPARSR
ncbi:MAG TPA: hypothetical protein VHY48_06280 [Acidobacteriaceae bacterium]|jgi:hypothetical protein|nr:hypothetical protein [Acidobacteriaceae bacterium]